MNQLVTVIVPVYKVEDLLRRCIDSILKQSYDNIEVILVDDGSPDNCGLICDHYASRDDRVVVIHKKNGGLADARNAGTDIARGQFITYIDSDDWVHRDYIKTLYNLMIQHDADLVVCNHLVTSRFLEDAALELTHVQIFERENIENVLWHVTDPQQKLHGPMVVAWGKLYKRSMIGALRYPVGKFHEDAFLTHKLLHLAQRIVFTNEKLVYYFQRGESINGIGFNIKKRLDMLESYQERERFFRQGNMNALADHCNKMYFNRVINIDQYLEQLPDRQIAREIALERSALLKKLRDGVFAIRFRLFYELYYLNPGLFKCCYQWFRRQ